MFIADKQVVYYRVTETYKYPDILLSWSLQYHDNWIYSASNFFLCHFYIYLSEVVQAQLLSKALCRKNYNF